MKFLIAGLGSIGRRHLRNLIALGERDVVLLRSHHATLPDDELAGFPVETDLHEALKKHRPEAVVVANPTALHLEVAIAAARAGCSILLEKPVSNSLERLDELRSALAERGGRLLVGFQFRFHPTLQKAAELLKGGSIGEPLSFHAHWGEYLPDWHPWEDFKQGYAARSDLGGGAILTLTHPLDYLRLLLGEAQALSAFTSNRNLKLPVEDAAEISLRMRSGAIGSVHLDYNQRPASHHWEITGTRGMLKWDYTSGALEAYSTPQIIQPEPAGRGVQAQGSWQIHAAPAGFERNVMFLEEMKHFISLVEKKEQPRCTLEDGRQALRLALAALEAAQKGTLVELN
jgi:predicted dehydrogenase